jgi:hypothetical protein
VQYKILPDGQPVLILSYPLKAVYINRFWEPVLNQFKSDDFFSTDQIAKNLPQFSAKVNAEYSRKRAFDHFTNAAPGTSLNFDLAACCIKRKVSDG